MTLVQYAAPAVEPLRQSEVLQFCRMDEPTQDISLMISMARQAAELQLSRYLITQTIDAYFDRFPESFVLPPLQTVTSITYVDALGATQTLASNQYQVDAVSVPARIIPVSGVTWPAVADRMNAVKVRFVAGYGDDPEDVPACVKHWMLLRIKQAIDVPHSMLISGAVPGMLPYQYIDGLLDSERVYGL